MVFENKKSKKKVELIYSNNEICVLVAEGETEGLIFNGNKTKLKQFFNRKAKEEDFVPDWLKKQIIDHITTDYEGIVRHPEYYANYSATLWQSEEEFTAMLEDLKDK